MIGVGVVLLSAFASFASPAFGQQAGSTGGDRGFQLRQNYPNPFNPETRIPFTLDEGLFQQGRPIVVSIAIYNVVRQFVAVPTALNHPAGNGTAVDHLEYTQPGDYLAYWDGLDSKGSKVGSGIYIVRLEVNGQHVVKKITVAK
jgi:hypothetical protein